MWRQTDGKPGYWETFTKTSVGKSFPEAEMLKDLAMPGVQHITINIQ